MMQTSRFSWILAAGLLVACGSPEPASTGGQSGSGGTGGSGGSGGSGGARCEVASPAEPGVIAIETGLLRGQKGEPTWVYRGIPYAAPPTGDLRWKPPAPAACWDGVRDALEFGSICPQIDSATKAEVGAEDCLTLNVWSPDTPGPHPVLVFIHGGGNIQGASSETLPGGAPTYNGHRLSKAGDAVVVTLNYRLGPLGFLTLPELSAESAWGASGNYGNLDQIAALQWVKTNIAAFGGDPTRVLLFGESAGGVNTVTLLASPLAKGLFSAALVESGGSTSTPRADAESAMAARVEASSCGSAPDRLACLRGKTEAELLAELPGSINIGSSSIGSDPSKYGPIVDGHLLPKPTLEILTAGEHNHVPFVIGTNRDELAKAMAVEVTTEQQYQSVITASFGPLAPKILSAYPVADYATPQEALVAVYSDLRFTCPARNIAKAVKKTQSEPVWRYFFTRRATTAKGQNPAAHAVELLYVFNSLTDIPLYQPAPEDLALSEAMMGYWARFGATGDPNGAGAPPWPAYDAQTDAHLVLDDPLTSGEGVRTAHCDFWEMVAGAEP